MRAEYQSPFSSSSRKLGDTERYRPSGVGCAREVTEKCKGAQRKTPTPPLDRRLARVRRALVDTRIVSTNLSLLKLPLSGRSVPRVQSRLVCGQPQRGAPNFTQHRIISRYALRFGPPNPFVRLKLLSDESLGDVNRSTKIPNKNKMVKKKKKSGKLHIGNLVPYSICIREGRPFDAGSGTARKPREARTKGATGATA